jgi:hypothetical protein
MKVKEFPGMKPEMLQSEHAIIFINYRRTDAGWPADYLADKLKSNFGQDRVFLDVRGIQAGDDFAVKLMSQLQRATVLIVLIGKNWLHVHDKFGRRRLDQENDWVRREIRIALEKEGCRVIPILLDDAELPNEEEALPEDISALLRRQRIRVRQTNCEDDIEALIKVLKSSGLQPLADSAAHVIPPKDAVIRLTRSKEDVAEELRGQIERGKVLLNRLQKSPPSSREELDDQSRYWHDWRRYSEQIMWQSFSSSEPLQRLKALTPRHLDFEKSWQNRAKNLPRDIEKELAYLENLLIRLDNYEEILEKT